MRAIVSQESLARALALSRAVASQSKISTAPGKPVLLRASCGLLTVSATCISHEVSISIEAKTETEGAMVVDLQRFEPLVRSMTGDILLGAAGTWGRPKLLVASSGEFHLNALDSDALPLKAFKVSTPLLTQTFQQGDFLRTLKKVVRAASDDPNKFQLHGICLEAKDAVRMVATDGRRLMLATMPVKDYAERPAVGVTLPRAAVEHLASLVGDFGDMSFSCDARQAVFRIEAAPKGPLKGEILYTTQLVEGKFVNYTVAIPHLVTHPENTPTMVVERELLLDAVGRVGIAVDEKAKASCIRFSKADERLLIQSWAAPLEKEGHAAQETAQETLEEAKFSGADWPGFMVNPRYISDAIAALPDDQVKILMTTPQEPVVVMTESRDFLGIIMPVRIPANAGR